MSANGARLFYTRMTRAYMNSVIFICVAYRKTYDMRMSVPMCVLVFSSLIHFTQLGTHYTLRTQNTLWLKCIWIVECVALICCALLKCMRSRHYTQYSSYSPLYTTGVKNMQFKVFPFASPHLFSSLVCYRNNVVCLKCMPTETKCYWNGTNLYDSISIQKQCNAMQEKKTHTHTHAVCPCSQMWLILEHVSYINLFYWIKWGTTNDMAFATIKFNL